MNKLLIDKKAIILPAIIKPILAINQLLVLVFLTGCSFHEENISQKSRSVSKSQKHWLEQGGYSESLDSHKTHNRDNVLEGGNTSQKNLNALKSQKHWLERGRYNQSLNSDVAYNHNASEEFSKNIGNVQSNRIIMDPVTNRYKPTKTNMHNQRAYDTKTGRIILDRNY